MTVLLKRALGEAGAFIDESNGGGPNLYEVLKKLAETSGPSLNVSVGSPVTAVIVTGILSEGLRLTRFAGRLGNTGSSGSTTVVMKVAGVVIATLTWASSEDNGTFKSADFTDDDLEQGELVEVEVTAVAAGPLADLSIDVRSQAVIVE